MRLWSRMARLLWKRFGQCSTECGIPLPSRHDGNSQTCPKAWTPSAFLLLAISMHVTLLPTEGSGETLSGLSPLYAVYLPSALPTPTHPNRAPSSPAALLTFTLPPSLCTSTSCVSSHLTCSCTKHLAPLLSPSLHVFASSISGHSHNCSLPVTHAHHGAAVLRQLWHNPDSLSSL